MCKGKQLIIATSLLLFAQLGSAQVGKTGATGNTAKAKTAAATTSAVKMNATIAKTAVAAEAKGFAGRYDLYAGTPSVYIGQIVLMAEGKYKVAFSTDESDYESGNYIYHADTNSLEWTSGLCKRNEWDGKLVKKSGGYRIEFSKTTFAEN